MSEPSLTAHDEFKDGKEESHERWDVTGMDCPHLHGQTGIDGIVLHPHVHPIKLFEIVGQMSIVHQDKPFELDTFFFQSNVHQIPKHTKLCVCNVMCVLDMCVVVV